MKRLLTLALPFVLAVGLSAIAQDTNSSSNPQATSPSTSSSQASSSSTASNSGQQASVEGCIVRQQTDYFLQPENGSPIKLNSTEDLSKHVGHHVRVEGSENSMGSSSSNTSGGSSSASNPASTSSSSNANQEIQVTRVQMISETCPANIQNKINQSGSQGTSNPSTPPKK